MVRAFVTVFFIFTVAGTTVAGGAVGADLSRSQSSGEGRNTVDCTCLDTHSGVQSELETKRQMSAQRDVGLATVPESRMKATITDTMKNVPRSWLIGFAVLVLVLIAGGIVYRNDIRTRTVDETETATSSSTITEADLLSDDDRVLMLLRDNDGRMKQANIVHETGWSKSKVSVVLSEMDDEGLISKLRIGRENIISITGDEPEAARSPFEDER